MPNRTVGPVTTSIGAATAGTAIIAWLLRELNIIDIPADIQASITIVIVFIAGYLVPPQKPIIIEDGVIANPDDIDQSIHDDFSE